MRPLFSSIKRQWHNLKMGIRSLIVWFPLIWSDRNYDEEYIYYLLRKKFKQMKKFYGNENNIFGTDGPTVVQDMDHCIELIDQLMNPDFYITEDMVEESDPKKWSQMWEDARKREEKDKHELWSYIEEHIDSWWD